MKRNLCSTLTAVAAAALLASCTQLSPYAGQQQRDIKALSAAETADYLQGKGMGFAKPAELNGYPGPMHVLELADRLNLTAEQRTTTRELLDRHKAEVRDLGKRYIEAETELDRGFASRSVNAQSLAAALGKSADLQRRIREAHLATHLKQTALLTSEQLDAYQRLRGYGDAAHAGH